MKTMVITGMMGLMASEGVGGRLPYVRRSHPRSDGYLNGAWIDQDWNPGEAARRNAEMDRDRKAHKARKLEEARKRLAERAKPTVRQFKAGKVESWG